MNQQQQPPINLDVFLERMAKLYRLLKPEHKRQISPDTYKNIYWYCDYKVHQYYKRYLEYKREKHYNSGKEKRTQPLACKLKVN